MQVHLKHMSSPDGRIKLSIHGTEHQSTLAKTKQLALSNKNTSPKGNQSINIPEVDEQKISKPIYWGGILDG